MCDRSCQNVSASAEVGSKKLNHRFEIGHREQNARIEIKTVETKHSYSSILSIQSKRKFLILPNPITILSSKKQFEDV